MSDSLAESFTKMVTLIDFETRFLKGMSSLRGADSEVRNKLKNIDSFVTDLENNLNDFETFVDQELTALSAMEQLGEQSELQKKDVEIMKENIPHFLLNTQQQSGEGEGRGKLREKKDSTATKKQQAQGQKTDKPSVSFDSSLPPPPSPSHDFTFITSDELEGVPKSTRSRLSLAQVNNALRTLVGLVGNKNKVSSSVCSMTPLLSFVSYNLHYFIPLLLS